MHEFKPPYHNRLAEFSSIFLNRIFLSRDVEWKFDEENLNLWRSIPRDAGLIVTVKHAHYTDHFSIVELAHRLKIRCYYVSIPESFREWLGLGGLYIRALGAFPVERAGQNHQAMRFIVNAVQKGGKPLVIFPEGELYFLNDVVTPLKLGMALFALEGAKARAEQGKPNSTYILPVGLKYRYDGNAEPLILRKLAECEKKLLGSSRQGEIVPRILQLSEAILAGAEKEFEVKTEGNRVEERFLSLSEKLTALLEGADHEKISHGDLSSRARKLLTLMPGNKAAFFAIHGLAFLPGYLENPTQERLMETARKLERLITQNEHPSFPGRKKLFLRLEPAIPVEPYLAGFLKPHGKKETMEKLSKDVQVSMQEAVNRLCK